MEEKTEKIYQAGIKALGIDVPIYKVEYFEGKFVYSLYGGRVLIYDPSTVKVEGEPAPAPAKPAARKKKAR